MLVMTRKLSEKIIVDGPCVITVVEIRGDRVQIGIDADKSVLILRAEVQRYDDTKVTGVSAAEVDAQDQPANGAVLRDDSIDVQANDGR